MTTLQPLPTPRSVSSPVPGVVIELAVRDLGRMAYAPVLELQRQIQQDVISRRRTDAGGDGGGMTLLLVEHNPPVITVSRRPGAGKHLIATEAQLAKAGVEVAQTDRGGDITYHGPGQLVVYPILDLNRLGLRLTSYMRLLEQIVIDSLATFGIEGQRDAAATGVWVAGGDAKATEAAPSKICAMGVRISRWVTMHGLALNVTTNLDHFNLIVPCGLVGRGVTSMQRELEAKCPTMDEVKAEITRQFQRAVTAAAACTHPGPTAA